MLDANDLNQLIPRSFGDYVHMLNGGQSFTYPESRDFMTQVLAIDDPTTRSAQMAILLNGLMARGPSVAEAVGAIDAVLAVDSIVPMDRPAHPFAGRRVVALGGSGKKGIKTANISTPAALVAAAAGVLVAKPASGATSSMIGSADLLTLFGVRLTRDANRTLETMAATGMGVFQIETQVPRFDARYGGLFYAPHVLSLALPALLVPVTPDAIVYGISSEAVGLSLDVIGHYHRGDALVVATTPDNERWVDELSLSGMSLLAWSVAEHRQWEQFVDLSAVVGEPVFPLPVPGTSAIEQTGRAVRLLFGASDPGYAATVAINAAGILSLANPDTGLRENFRVAQDILNAGAAGETLLSLVSASGGNPSFVEALRRTRLHDCDLPA